MKYAAITSMNEAYYNHCGRTMLKSYKKYFSTITPLYVYNEDEFEIKVKTITSMGWNLGIQYNSFQQRHTNDRVKTFAKKGFSIIHAMDNVEADRIIWLDADIVFHEEMPSQLLDLIAVTGLRRFYDGEVYGKTVDLMEARGYKMLNLNPADHKTPISRSVLSPYLSHYKAGLKDAIDFQNLETNLKDEV